LRRPPLNRFVFILAKGFELFAFELFAFELFAFELFAFAFVFLLLAGSRVHGGSSTGSRVHGGSSTGSRVHGGSSTGSRVHGCSSIVFYKITTDLKSRDSSL
jgi:hypothetical protein